MVREHRVILSTQSDLDAGAGYLITVLEPGAQVSSASSGTTVNVRAGHGLEAGDRFIVGVDTGRYREVDSVSSTQIVTTTPVSVASGEFLINLGTETASPPTYTESGAAIYTDMAYINQASGSTVTADAEGRYRYFHKGIARWELVRTSTGTPVAYYLDTDNPADEDQVSYGVRYAHLFATSGTGTAASPWVTAGSNPVQAALNDLPTRGGVIHMVAGHYDLGSATVAVNIPILTSGIDYDHQYVFRGDGRDMTFLRYSGTGTAFRYAQTAIGPLPEVGSWQSNQLLFTDFAVLQAGTDFTGNAFWCSYVNECVFQRLTIGTPRVLAGSVGSEEGYGFEYGIRLEGSVVGQNVVDFNRIDTCLINGNTYGVYAQNQADNLVVEKCWFQPDLANTGEVYGMEIHNSNGYLVQGNHFNYYGRGASFSGSPFALKLSGYARGATVMANYFERNPVSIWLLVDGAAGTSGVNLIGNFVSFTSTTSSFGIRVGQDGGFSATGINIIGNSFIALAATNVGIRIGSDVDHCVIQSNCYDNTGGTNRSVQNGANVFVNELFDSVNFVPIVNLQTHFDTSSPGEVRLQNTSTGNYPSPRIKIIPGSGGSGAGAGCFLGVAATGDFQVQDTNGIFKFSVDQSGNASSVGGLTSGGHLQGLKETFNLSSNDVIPHGGRFMVDITNVSGTNTFTVAAPSSNDGKIFILRCAALTAGTMTLADSGNVSLSAAWVPDAGDTLTLVASGVVWYELARSAN